MALPPLADLLALLPDNDVGAIEAVNQRDITSALYSGITDNTALFADYLPLSGGQMIGDLRLPNPPVNLLDACNKEYVDSVAGNAGFVQKGGDTMDGDLIAFSDDAPTPRSYTPRIYTEQLINDSFTAVNPLLPDGSVNMAADYTPTNAKGLVTKEYADALTPDNTGNLRSDGSVDMDAGYTPQNPLSITTKEYVEDTFSWSTVELLSAPVTALGLTPERVDFANGFTIDDFDEILITAEVLGDGTGQPEPFVKIDSTLVTRQMYKTLYGETDSSAFVVASFVNSAFQDSIRANVIDNDPTGFSFKNDFFNNTNNIIIGTRLLSIQGRKKGKVDNVTINDSEVVLWNDGHTLDPNSGASNLIINLPAGLVWNDFDEITVYYAISDPTMSFGEGRMRSNTIKTSMINYTGANFETIGLMWLYGDTDTTQGNYRFGELTRFTPNTAELVAGSTLSNNNLNQRVQVYEIVGRKRGKIDSVVLNNVYRASFEMAANQFVDTIVNQASLLVNSKRIDNLAFSHTDGTSDITILKDGWLKCTGVMGYATTVEGDNCRAVGRTLARVNGQNLAGTSLNGGYIRAVDTSGSNISSSCQISFEIPVVAGDIVAVQGFIYKIDNNCTTTTFLLAGENVVDSGFQISNFSFELVEDGA